MPELPDISALTEQLFRSSYRKLVGILARYFGLKELALAEDIVQETLLEALEQWPATAVPRNPEAWLMDVAKKKTINRLRRDQLLQQKILPGLEAPENSFAHAEAFDELLSDSTLRMLFACCHPALAAEAQLALALKNLCGLSVPSIASALLSSESTINKRLYRARQKFRTQAIPFEVPAQPQLEARIESVLQVLYLLFSEGHHSRHSEHSIRAELCYEAIRLLRLLLEAFPNQPNAKALLALMLLHAARLESRVGNAGMLLTLMEQDRSQWNQQLLSEGMELLHQSIATPQASVWQLRAGIAAEHSLAPHFEATNWRSVARQYALLQQLDKSPMVALNHQIARFFASHEADALQAITALGATGSLVGNALYHATLAILLHRTGAPSAARQQKDLALQHAIGPAELQQLAHRLKYVD